MTKIERLFNIIALLITTRRPLTAAEIREKTGAYSGMSEDTFHRTFERDKVELRELGFALEQEDTDAWGTEKGYRIHEAEELLRDPGLTPAEIAALSLAAQTWSGSAGDEGALALLKLSVSGGAAEPSSGPWVMPRVPVDRPVRRLIDAIARRKRVRFAYRKPGDPSAEPREVEPHALSFRGDWYLTGRDTRLGEPRHFKLSRVEGELQVTGGSAPDFTPPVKPGRTVPRGPWEFEGATEGRVLFAPSAAWWVERRTGARRIAERDDGWVELAVRLPEPDQAAGWIAGFADDAVVLSPPELRDRVIAHLRRAAEVADAG